MTDANHDLSQASLGHYRIEALIGRGGMGEVYRARESGPIRRRRSGRSRSMATNLARFSEDFLLRGDLSPDGKMLLVARVAASQEPYLITNFR